MKPFDLNDLASPWFSLIYRIQQGHHVEKQSIIDLLRSDAPVIDEAKTLIANVIEGKHKFKRGIKQNKLLMSPLTRLRISMAVDDLEAVFAKDTRKTRGETARDKAKDEVAKWYGTSVRTIEAIIEEQCKIRARRKIKK